MPHASKVSVQKVAIDHLIEFRPRLVYRGLDELAASLKEHGQLEPLVVRLSSKTAGKKTLYEIAAGTRRKRAAIIAGRADLDCIVRDMSDEEMLAVSIAENRNREDTHPLEEALGFVDLHDTFGVSAGDLAARFGVSADYVYGRLKLARMHTDLRAAFLADKFSVKGALVLAGLADTMQAKVWGELSKMPEMPLSAAKITGFIRDRYLMKLVTAPFPIDDPKLVEKAPECGRCPKRTGVQAPLFPEDLGTDDRCTDVACFTAKKQAHAEVLIERATQENLRVLEKAEAREVFKFGESTELLNPDCAFVAVDGKVRLGEEGTSYRKLLAGAPPPIVVAVNPGGAAIELYEKQAVAKSMRALKVPFVREWESVILPKDKPGAASTAEKPDRAEVKLERRAAELAIDEIRMSVEATMTPVANSPRSKKLMQLTALIAARNTWAQVQKAYVRKHKLDDAQTGGDANARVLAMLEAHVSKLNEAQCIGFVVELGLLREVFGAAGGPDVRAEPLERGFAILGTKFDAFRKQAAKPQEAPKKGRTLVEAPEPATKAPRGRGARSRGRKTASEGSGAETEEESGAGGMCGVCSCTRAEPCKRERGDCERASGAELCSHCEDIYAVVKSVVEEKVYPFRLDEVFRAVYEQDLVSNTEEARDVVRECMSMLIDEGAADPLPDDRYQRTASAA